MSQNEPAQLSAKQNRFVQAMVMYSTIEDARKQVRISKVTAFRWRQIPEIVDAIETERRKLLDSIRDQFQAAASEAILTLRGLLKSESDTIKIRVAEILLRPFAVCGINERKPEEQNGTVKNDPYWMNDEELYDLLKRKHEAGNGIDPEAIGYDVAGLAEAISQNRGQAKQVTPASAGLSRQEGSLIGGQP